jgi:hypothetical protein
LNAVENGKTFISNGPLIFGSIAGKTYGDTVTTSDPVLNLELFCRDGLDTINIIKNGNYYYSLDITGTDYQSEINLEEINSGDWIVIEVYGTGVYYGITNPIFFE